LLLFKAIFSGKDGKTYGRLIGKVLNFWWRNA
jgi:hypothetical protein